MTILRVPWNIRITCLSSPSVVLAHRDSHCARRAGGRDSPSLPLLCSLSRSLSVLSLCSSRRFRLVAIVESLRSVAAGASHARTNYLRLRTWCRKWGDWSRTHVRCIGCLLWHVDDWRPKSPVMKPGRPTNATNGWTYFLELLLLICLLLPSYTLLNTTRI